MADLIAYLKRLETEVDPGVGADRLRVGSLLPLDGPQAATGRAMAAMMSAWFEEINDDGGIFGRRIELQEIPFGPTPERRLEPLREALAAGEVFALVGAYTVGADAAVLDVLRAEGVPLVGPFTLDPGDSLADAAAFYLYPGFEEQVRVLADQARSGLEEGDGLLVVAPGDDRAGRLVNAIQQQLARHGAPAATVTRYATGGFDAAEVTSRAAGAGAIIHLGDQNALEALLAALAVEERAPRIYLLSSFAPRPLTGAPRAFDGRIVLAYPTDASDVTAEGLADYRGLAARHALPRDHVQAQIAALAAAKLLVEGLRRSGRDLDRRRLVESLEALYAFRTGLTPPLTYGPNRRIGARGAHLLSVDLARQTYVPVGDGWYDVR
jgi:ABC-type branched-subunit amino acid transport system substrate-binding protein